MIHEGNIFQQIVHQKRMAVAEIARKLEVSRTMVYNYFNMAVLPEDVKKKLLKLTGVKESEFSQFLTNDAQTSVKTSNELVSGGDNKIKFLNVEGIKSPKKNLIIVPVKAFGGFLSGYNDPSFMNTLEREHYEHIQGECFKFEVDGYSMFLSKLEGGLIWKVGYEPGSWVIATPVESFGWLTKGKDYVFQTTEGILIKRFVRTERDMIYIESINPEFSTKPLHMKTVKRVYLIERQDHKSLNY